MELIEKYIHEVTRRLPETSRQDIALELESTIYDMLPEEYTEQDIYTVLENMGSPSLLASKYTDKPMHIIGPKYYDLYISLFKLILPIVLIFSLISIVLGKIADPIADGAILEMLITIFSESIWTIIIVFIHTFFWLTFIFVILERTDGTKDQRPRSLTLKPWTPEDLKSIPYVPKKKSISIYQAYTSIFFSIIWGVIYFYANHVVGIYENAEQGFHMVTPVFQQEVLMVFWPLIILLIAAEIALSIYKLIQKQWTLLLASLSTVKEVVAVIIFVFIFMHENIFAPEFLHQLGELFQITPETLESRIVWGGIAITVLYAGITIFDMYRKANIKVKA